MPARTVLTEKAIEKCKAAPLGKRNFLWDAVAPSLALRVTDRGHKSWVVQRRVNGAMRRVTFGDYPAISLSKAREKAQAVLGLMAKGVDPKHAPAKDKAAFLGNGKATARREDSFEGLVAAYLKREARYRRPRTADEIKRTLEKTFVSKWGSRDITQISSRDVRAVLDEFVDAGSPIAANRAYSILRRFLNWCVEREALPTNPIAGMKKPAREKTRDRVLSIDELKDIWAACGTLGWPFGDMFRALILTGQRRTECAGMTWAEVDLEKRHWTIPASRTKNAREHVVPLSDVLLAILREAPRGGGAESDAPVFTTNFRSYSSGFSRAKRRLDKMIMNARERLAKQAGAGKAKPLPAFTIHDLRRSVATRMAEDLKIAPHVIEAVLNHQSGFRSGVTGIYQRQSYMEERRDALQSWAEYVTERRSA